MRSDTSLIDFERQLERQAAVDRAAHNATKFRGGSGGAITLPVGRQLALSELLAARESGAARLSPRGAQPKGEWLMRVREWDANPRPFALT